MTRTKIFVYAKDHIDFSELGHQEPSLHDLTNHQVSLDKLMDEMALSHFKLDDYVVQFFHGRLLTLKERQSGQPKHYKFDS